MICDLRFAICKRVLPAIYQYQIAKSLFLSCSNSLGGAIVAGMKKRHAPKNPPAPPTLELEDFQTPPEDQGLSLEELSTAYAELLQRGSTPYAESTVESAVEAPAIESPEPAEKPDADLDCDLSPRSILEAMLFVGNSQNQPLTARQVAALMRGVRPQEIDELVRELNQLYTAEGCPYFIASIDAGYQLQLRDEYAFLRDSFYSRIKEAKLTQQAVDVLAIVAYKQPVR